MDNQEFDNYLMRFPNAFREYLAKKKHKERFRNYVLFNYEKKVVYRAIHGELSVTKEDFLNNIETADYYDLDSKPNESLECFGTSVNESLEMLEMQLKIPNKKLKLVAVAKGLMSSQFGPASFDEDRPHHNWYLFEDCKEKLILEFGVEKTYE